jgi:hypothetical protein
MIPDDENISNGGKDALFVSENLLMVAGGDSLQKWDDFNIDSSLYANDLLKGIGE